MTPHKQLITHDPDNGAWGDCGRTTVACLLDMHPSEVPHFWDKGAKGQELDDALNSWLEPHGLFVMNLTLNADSVQEALDYYGKMFCGSHYVFVGSSDRGCNHAVIARGNAVVHDPSLRDTGIVGPCLEGDYVATIFCRRM